MITLHKTEEYTTYKNRKIIDKAGIERNHQLPEGLELYSSSCGKFTILKCVGLVRGLKHPQYEIRFNDTGETYYADRSNIDKGKIKDAMHPMICDVGYLGREYEELKARDPELYKVMKSRFNEIINRCYNENDINYSKYGAVGIKVDERWHNFCNFYTDIVNLPNFNKDGFINGKLIISNQKKDYSRENVILMTYSEHHKLTSTAPKKYFIAISPTGEEVLWQGVNDFMRSTGFAKSAIHYVLNGTKSHIHGYKLRYLNEDEEKRIQSGELKPGDRLN